MEIALPGPAGTLVGVLEEPGEPRPAAAIVCHPHPLYGGSLRNTIVVRTARALRAAGLVTLRFNFRGVEGSAGRHDGRAEVEDAAAALAFLAARRPGASLWAAGYSFGSRVVAELASRTPAIERVVLIAFPAAVESPAVLARLTQPGLIVLGGADPFGTPQDLERGLPERPAGLELAVVPEADHFFRGRTPLVEESVLRYARAALSGDER